MNSTPINLFLTDDDLDDCLMFTEALEELNISINLKVLNDGVELMNSLFEKNLPKPNVIFLDLNMPRKTGFECLNEIRKNENLNQIPVIIFSTCSDTTIINRLYEDRANFYICKPVVFSDLKKVISKSLELISKPSKSQVSKDSFVITA